MPANPLQLKKIGLLSTLLSGKNLWLSSFVVMGGLAGLLSARQVAAQAEKINVAKDSIGQFILKADLGYIQNLATHWTNADKKTKFASRANGTVGYGASLGWTHASGFGLSAEYLGFSNSWIDKNTHYNANYHVVTFTPSYRFAFGQDNHWGIKLGLGLGFSISDIVWSASTQSAQSANYSGNKTKLLTGGIITTTNGQSSSLKIASGAAYSVNGTTRSTADINHSNGTAYHSSYGNARYMLDSKGIPTATVFYSNSGIVTIQPNSTFHCLDEGGGSFGESDCRNYTNGGVSTLDDRSYDEIIVDRLKANTIKLINSTGPVSKQVILALLNDGSATAVGVYNNWLSSLSGNWQESLNGNEVLWMSYDALQRINGANTAIKLANLQGFIDQGLFYNSYVSKDGHVGVGWKVLADDPARAQQFRSLLSQATATNMGKLNANDVLWVSDDVWKNLAGDTETDKKAKVEALKGGSGSARTGYIFYGTVAKEGAGGTGWKAWLLDSSKASLFNQLYDNARPANMEKLSNGEVLWLPNSILQGISGNNIAIQIAKIEALKGPNSYIFYGTVAKGTGLGTGWKGFLDNGNAYATQFISLFNATNYINLEALSSQDVLYISDNVLTSISGATTNEKRTKLEGLKGGTAQNPTGYIFYDQVKKDGLAGTGWKAWTNNARYAELFKNLLTAATPANMEKLGSRDVVYVADAVWQGLSGANENAKKSQLEELKGGSGQNRTGYIFYGTVAKTTTGRTGWKDWLFDNAKAVEFNNLYDAATPVHMEKLSDGEILFVSDDVLKNVTGGDDNVRKTKIAALRNPAVKNYLYFGSVQKIDTSYGLGWVNMILDTTKLTLLKNIIATAGINNFEKLTSGESITLPYEIWHSFDGATDSEKQSTLQQLSDGTGIIAFATRPEINTTPVPKPNPLSNPNANGAAEDDAGFVLAPVVALEYNNGLLHADVNFRYLHALKDVKYNGVNGTNNDKHQLAGPLAMFIGAGFGINF